MTYRIREVDASREDIAEVIRIFNQKSDVGFPDLTDDELDSGYWWLAYHKGQPVAFAGMVASRQWHSVGYFKRAGVAPRHRGNGLQIRLMRVRERKARLLGWTHLISECTETAYSANNFIKAGFKIFDPKYPWAFKNSIYWIKGL